MFIYSVKVDEIAEEPEDPEEDFSDRTCNETFFKEHKFAKKTFKITVEMFENLNEAVTVQLIKYEISKQMNKALLVACLNNRAWAHKAIIMETKTTKVRQ